MKNKKMMKASSLALASALLVSGVPFQSVAGAATVSSISQHITKINELTNASVSTGTAVKAGAYISPKLNNISGDVNVIVQFTGDPLSVSQFSSKSTGKTFMSAAAESAIAAEQSTFINAAKTAGLDMTVNYQFNTVVNAVEVTIPANQIPQLALLPNVKSIFENSTYYAIPDASDNGAGGNTNFDMVPIHQIGADQLWADGITGKGLKVGVIDTGVDYVHPDLKTAFKGGHDSFFNTSDPYEEAPNAQTGNAGTSHGTHVSGTIAGRALNSTSEISQKGIAYEADLYVYKVLGYNMETKKSSGTTAQVIDGIERSVKDGMDVINLSLGSDDVKDPNSPDIIAINNAVLAGVVACVANGNAGPNFYTMGSPAASQLAISVGAATSDNFKYSSKMMSSFDGALSYDLNVLQWTIGHTDFANMIGTDPVEGVYVGLGGAADFAGKDLTGKIAFMSRGNYPFADKYKFAKEHGARAVVIFNGNATNGGSGTVPDLDLVDPTRDGYIASGNGEGFDNIPVYDMKGTEGRALAKQVLTNPATPLVFTFSNFQNQITPGDKMASFSSRGPQTDGNYSIKPDFTAPGVAIMSTYPAYGKGNPSISYDKAYTRLNGTSMATPHVAGLALLLKQVHPDWTPFDIRAALANTADNMNTLGGVQYDVYSQGAGRVNVVAAAATPALLTTVDNINILDNNLNQQNVTNFNDSASFGLMAPGSAAKSELLQLKNTSGDTVSYTASIQMHNNVTSESSQSKPTPDVSNIIASLDGLGAGDTITVGGHSTEKFSLNVQPKVTAAAGVYEGEVVLESNDADLPDLHLPFVVNVGTTPPSNGMGLQDMEVTPTVITPNNDNINDKAEVTVQLNATAANYVSLEVVDTNDKTVGTIAELFSFDSNNKLKTIPAGKLTFSNIDGTYVDDEVDANGDSVVKHLKDGTYQLQVNAYKLNDQMTKVVTNYGSTYKTFGVSFTDNEQVKVTQAKDQFKATVANTTKTGAAVLTLPTTAGITYKVTASSNTQYIDNNGVLQKLPTLGNQKVDLTVTIASATNPAINTTAKVSVTLNPISTKPYLVQSSSLTRTDGLKATVNIAANPNGGIYTGSSVVVFQLMNGTTPVSIVAVSKGNTGAADVAAQFFVTGANYWVKVFVVDSINSSLTDVGNTLADSVDLH